MIYIYVYLLHELLKAQSVIAAYAHYLILFVYWNLQGQIEQWIDFSANEIDTNIGRWLYPRVGYGLYLPPVYQASECYLNPYAFLMVY